MLQPLLDLPLLDVPLPPANALAVLGGLSICNLAALGLMQLKGRLGHAVAVAGMALLFHGVESLTVDAIGMAFGDWWTGDARWTGADSGANPGRRSRLLGRAPEPPMSCLTPSGWFETYDDTVGVLVRLFGQGPGAYDGPYPTRDEALSLLAKAGQPWSWGEGAELRVGQARFPLIDDRPTPAELREALEIIEALREAAGGPRDELDGAFEGHLHPIDLERGLLLRGVPLREDALLVETNTAIELRLWDRPQQLGRVWASWER